MQSVSASVSNVEYRLNILLRIQILAKLKTNEQYQSPRVVTSQWMPRHASNLLGHGFELVSSSILQVTSMVITWRIVRKTKGCNGSTAELHDTPKAAV